MRHSIKEPEILLEAGMIVTAMGLVWAAGMLLLAHSVRLAKRQHSSREAPLPGRAPKNRYANITAVS